MSEVTSYQGTELNDELYPLVAAGDKAAHERMILNNVDLVEWRVDEFVRRVPSAETLRDDLISEGYLALTQAVDDLCNGESQCSNPTGYLSTAIQFAIEKYDDRQAMIAMPPRTKARARDNDE